MSKPIAIPVPIPNKTIVEAPTPFQSPAAGIMVAGCFNNQLEDIEFSRRISDRTFANYTSLASPEVQAEVSSRLAGLSGFRTHNGRYCIPK